jgi:hypothetical protein
MYTNISNHLPQLNGKTDKYVTHLSVKSMALLLSAPSTVSYNMYRNPSVIVTRVRHDESTSNLVRHSDRCAPGATTTTSSIASFAHGSTYSYPKFHVKLALWVARHHRPFSIVEDEELINIFMDLNNKVEVLSCVTVSHDVKEIPDQPI